MSGIGAISQQIFFSDTSALTNIRNLLNQIKSANQSAQYQSAIDQANTALEMIPENEFFLQEKVELYHELAFALLQIGQAKEAKKAANLGLDVLYGSEFEEDFFTLAEIKYTALKTYCYFHLHRFGNPEKKKYYLDQALSFSERGITLIDPFFDDDDNTLINPHLLATINFLSAFGWAMVSSHPGRNRRNCFQTALARAEIGLEYEPSDPILVKNLEEIIQFVRENTQK